MGTGGGGFIKDNDDNKKIEGGTDNTIIGNTLDQLHVSDRANESGVYGAITVGTAAVEVKVGTSKLAGRKTVTVNSFFEIPAAEYASWALDDTIVTALGTPTDYTMSVDGTTDYSATAASNIQLLQNQTPLTITPTALPDPASFRFRGDATPWTTCAPGVTNLELTMTEERYVDGGVVIVENANPGDYCVFQVVHPLAGVVEQFVNKWYVIPGTGKMDVNVYRAKVPAGLIIRIVYNNVGSTSVGCGINLRLHKLGM